MPSNATAFIERIVETQNQQEPVMTHDGIDKILGELSTLTLDELPDDYRRIAKLDQINKSHYRNRHFYVIQPSDRQRLIVGHFRISDLLPETSVADTEHDEQNPHFDWPSGSQETYLFIDTKLLYRLLDLILELKNQGYDHRAMTIYYGYRPPAHNHNINGARRSQHLYGKALDMWAGDVNRDGHENIDDKMIILNILEKKIFPGTGGIGRYMNTPRAIHFDIRSKKSRWNK